MEEGTTLLHTCRVPPHRKNSVTVNISALAKITIRNILFFSFFFFLFFTLKVSKDEGASRPDRDQKTCQQNDLCRSKPVFLSSLSNLLMFARDTLLPHFNLSDTALNSHNG